MDDETLYYAQLNKRHSQPENKYTLHRMTINDFCDYWKKEYGRHDVIVSLIIERRITRRFDRCTGLASVYDDVTTRIPRTRTVLIF